MCSGAKDPTTKLWMFELWCFCN